MALTIVATSDCVWAGSATPNSIMVVPARKRLVQLAFKIAQCKEIGLVTYNTSPGLSAPLLHAWNGREWIQISMDDYVEGRFMSGDPKHVFLLGDVSSLPLQMMDGPTWYKGLNRITTFDTATIVNQMGNVLHFSARQWKWLAEIYGMKIKDESTEQRRYGRWGAPGKEVDLTPNKLETVVLPPAPLITDFTVEKKAAPVSSVKVEEPQAKIEPVKAEMPLPPQTEAPAVAAPVVPLTVTIKPETAKIEAVNVEKPAVKEDVIPVAPAVTPAAK